jgi:hypothetical protein
MVHILSGIKSLMQYQSVLLNKKVDFYRLEKCLWCGQSKPHRHGGYSREADRISKSRDSLNPVFIQRYYCRSCRKTCSVLPECIPPRHSCNNSIYQNELCLIKILLKDALL